MRVFKTKRFSKWAKKEKLSDSALCKAVHEMEEGMIDAKLTGPIYKKRVAQQGRGKRGSYRTILAFKVADKAFFIFGFAKNKMDNIDKEQLVQLKTLGLWLLGYSDDELKRALQEKALIEVYYE